MLSWVLVAILIGRGVDGLLAHRRFQRTGLSRLAELRGGAAEAYFEERRELEAYPSRAVSLQRWPSLVGIGLGMLLAAWLLLH